MTLDSGPAFFYGQPVISGSQRYPESIALHLNPTKPGKPVRQQDLFDYQTALEASGYYAQAVVSIEPDPALAAAVPIRVELVERPEKLFSVGAGYSTDTGVRVQTAWQHRDILDQGLRLKLEALPGNQGAEPGWRSCPGRAMPGAMTTAWACNSSRRTSRVRKRVPPRWRPSAAAPAARSRRRCRCSTRLKNRPSAMCWTRVTKRWPLNYAWTQRTVGRAIYPRRGYVLTLQGSGAAEALLSDTSFIRLYGRHTHYFRAGDNGRLVLRGELGSVLAETREGIPTDYPFRAGGDNSVRGYAFESLGRTLEGGVASVRYLATGSVEYNYFFDRDWGMALFVDAGDAADSFGSLSPVFGYGVGARYRSPVGPVNLDLAYGEDTDEFRLHFSLGVSF